MTVRASDGLASATLDVTLTVTDVPEPPLAPLAPTVTAGSLTSLTMSWSAPGNTGRPSITGYRLQYRSGASGPWTVWPQEVSGTSAVIANLTADTAYQVQVRAVNADGAGPWSPSGSGSTRTPRPPPPPPPPPPPSPPQGSGGPGNGDRQARVVGYVENPAPGSFQSGIGVISGWVCEAETVSIELGGSAHAAAYGTERADTQGECGDSDNGFGLLFNWNLLGDGAHDVVAYVDGTELARTTVRVTTLGEEFVRDVAGACVVADFPAPGETVTLEWQQPSQNFVMTAIE